MLNLSLGFDIAVFDVTLPATTSIIRGKTEEQRTETVTQAGKLALAGTMHRYLRLIMYNIEELLMACKLTHKNNKEERQEKEDDNKGKEVAICDKAS